MLVAGILASSRSAKRKNTNGFNTALLRAEEAGTEADNFANRYEPPEGLDDFHGEDFGRP